MHFGLSPPEGILIKNYKWFHERISSSRRLASGAKAQFHWTMSGTAEAVPFHKNHLRKQFQFSRSDFLWLRAGQSNCDQGLAGSVFSGTNTIRHADSAISIAGERQAGKALQ